MGINTLPVAKSTAKVWTIYSVPNYTSISGNSSGNSGPYDVSTTVYYLGGLFIFGTGNGYIGYSTDAKNWNYQLITATFVKINTIAFNGSIWVIGASDNLLYSGTPGGTWTARTSQLTGTNPVYSVIWVSGSINLFILIGQSDSPSNFISSSSDGITWTARYSASTQPTGLAVNTAQTTIVVSTQITTANQQAVYSTNGTSWSFAPVRSTVATCGFIYYLPHADRFVASNLSDRRSPSTVGTASWNTAGSREIQRAYNFSAFQSSNTYANQRILPIWDSANSKYYVTDVSATGGQFWATLTTLNGTDVTTSYTTGTSTTYALPVNKIEILPVNVGGAYPSSGGSYSDPPSLGYGNGIWVAVSASGSWQTAALGSLSVSSTAV